MPADNRPWDMFLEPGGSPLPDLCLWTIGPPILPQRGTSQNVSAYADEHRIEENEDYSS